MKTIIRTSIIIVLFQLYSFNLISQSQSQILELCIKGAVTLVNDATNVFGISVGDSIYGTIKYDLSIPNPNPLGSSSQYSYMVPPNGIKVNINSLIFQTDMNDVNLELDISNNNGNPQADGLSFTSANNIVTPTVSGIDQHMIYWSLFDPSATALSNTDIPTFINLDSWQQQDFEIMFIMNTGNIINIKALVTDAEVCSTTPPPVIPLSNWALFIGIGLILVFAVVRFRRML
jgi:hypothetical protein